MWGAYIKHIKMNTKQYIEVKHFSVTKHIFVLGIPTSYLTSQGILKFYLSFYNEKVSDVVQFVKQWKI